MNIIVCIKQVPNTAQVQLDPQTNTLIRQGLPSIINPDDKAALTEALRQKEEKGAHVTVLCMGPRQASLALTKVFFYATALLLVPIPLPPLICFLWQFAESGAMT